MATVAVVLPTIPPRKELLRVAMTSVFNQTRKPNQFIVESDPRGTGSAATRNRGNARVISDYIAVLDDDDELLPNHIEVLMRAAEQNPEADVIYPIPDIRLPRDPTAVRVNGKIVKPWGLEWTEDHRQWMIQRGNFIPHTCLMKTETVRRHGGYPETGGSSPCDDWNLLGKIALHSGVFLHVPEITWIWGVNPLGHTGGHAERWKETP